MRKKRKDWNMKDPQPSFRCVFFFFHAHFWLHLRDEKNLGHREKKIFNKHFQGANSELNSLFSKENTLNSEEWPNLEQKSSECYGPSFSSSKYHWRFLRLLTESHPSSEVTAKYKYFLRQSETSKRHLKRQQPQNDAKSDAYFPSIVQFLTCHFMVVAFRGRCTILQKSSFHGCWLAIVVVWRSLRVQHLLRSGKTDPVQFKGVF